MTDETTPFAETVPTLTDAEKRLRDWLMRHPEGGEMWMIVKGGFRRSYAHGREDALNDAVNAVEPGGAGGPGKLPDHWSAIERLSFLSGMDRAAQLIRDLRKSPGSRSTDGAS